jgi:hypothetical protein
LCLDDFCTTTIISQLTEITQFIFGQPLSAAANVPLITNDGRVLAEGGAVGIEALTPRASTAIRFPTKFFSRA